MQIFGTPSDHGLSTSPLTDASRQVKKGWQLGVHYATLKQPLDVEVFIVDLKQEMQAAWEALARGLPTKTHVTITDREGGKNRLSPFEAQAEPVRLARLKAEISQRWPMIGLRVALRVKEADLHVLFTDPFQAAIGNVRLNPAILQKRLLVFFYGPGTNIGLQRVKGGNHG